MSKQTLLTLFKTDNLILKNRVVLAPMTRARADNEGNVPNDLMVEYYKQRATAGLLISEGTWVSKEAAGYINVPGIYTQEQIDGWKKVTDAVRPYGNLFFAQLWHVGRMSHPDILDGGQPVAPSALNANDKVFTPSGFVDTATPKAMTLDHIQKTISDFVQAAKNAFLAGFDGIELHGANGYLFHQFFSKSSNVRTDLYGGSIENRARFLFDVLDAMLEAGIDLNKVGVRLNPSLHGLAGIELDAESVPTFDYIIERLNNYTLAYIHLLQPLTDISDNKFAEKSIAERYRKIYRGTLIINNGFTSEQGNKIINDGQADLVSFGKLFISNPDLPARFAKNSPLAEADKETFYTPGPKGYTDYPALEDQN